MRIKTRLSIWLPPIIWAAVIYLLSSFPSLTVEALGTWDYFFRKIWHMIEYAVLAVLFVRLGIERNQADRTVYIISVLGAFFYAVTDEWHQTFVTGRVGTPTDVGIDSLGAIAGVVLFASIRRKRSRSR
ncbi:MAG: VanZ family protein [Patescibacteria group bacterium]